MLVSICIPTYNRKDSLAVCLAQLLPQLQDVTDAEVVVCDNASTDGTWEYLCDLAARTPRFRIFRNRHNLGLDKNLMRVVELAEGVFISLMSDDDAPLAEYVATIRQYLLSEDPDVLYVNYYIHRGDIRKPVMLAHKICDRIFARAEDIICYTNLGHFSALTMRRALALQQFDIAKRFGEAGFSRAYALYALGIGTAVSGNKPKIFVGKPIFSANGPLKIDYNFIQNMPIDYVRHLEFWHDRGQLDSDCIKAVKLRYRRVLPRLLLKQRLAWNTELSAEMKDALDEIYGDSLFYWVQSFVILNLPAGLVRAPYNTNLH